MTEMASSARTRLARKLMIDLSIMTVIGVVLALVGPFGTFENPLPVRLISWLGFSYIGYAIYSPIGAVVDRVQKALDLPAAGLWVAGVLIATIPMSALVWSMGYLPGPVAMPSLEQALTNYAYVLVIGGGVTALFYTLESGKVSAIDLVTGPVTGPVTDSVSGGAGSRPDVVIAEVQQAPDQQASEPPARFLERLPLALGTDLLALEMEDHYVRAHTALGSELILMRMRDAVAELDGVEGSQVHRSWWVARDAIEGTKRDGRNLRLELASGLEAPVSRNMAPQLKTLGWI